ncbi:MAG TPA: hypothetical protein VFW07_02135 [Parafilimonas sp.]|nr:hypothetical protein [Parafilimonas sp.]
MKNVIFFLLICMAFGCSSSRDGRSGPKEAPSKGVDVQGNKNEVVKMADGVIADSVFGLPSVCGKPDVSFFQRYKNAARVAYSVFDTCNSIQYVYNPRTNAISANGAAAIAVPVTKIPFGDSASGLTSSPFYSFGQNRPKADSGYIGMNIPDFVSLHGIRGFPGMTISVTDNLRGGKFDFFDSGANLIVDDAIIIRAPNGYWVRDLSQTDKVFVTWFGAKGDGKNNDSKAIQMANDYVERKGGGTVWFPPNTDTSKYYRLTRPVYRASGVHWEGVQDKSIIYNDTAFYGFNTQGCMFLGNYQPTAYSEAMYYDMNMFDTSNKIVLTGSYADSITRFKTGDIVIIKGLTSWYSSKGHEKPYVVRINEVDSVLTASKTIVLKYQLDTILKSGKISITGHFIEGADKDRDNFKHPSYFVKNCATKNLVFKSNGQWMLGVSALNCTFENLKIISAEIYSGNSTAFCTLKNIYGNWWKQVYEFSIGSHNTTVEGTTVSYINNPYLIEEGTKQPCIKFGENVFAITLKDVYINAGNYSGRGIWFGAARYCTADNITLIGKRLTRSFVEFSNTENDVADASYVTDNKVINSNFHANSVDTIGYFVLMEKPAIQSARLENNSVINSNFSGKVSSKHAIRLDGMNPLISNVNAETGALMRGDSLLNGIVEGGSFDNPFTVTGTDAGITFKNVSDRTGRIRTDVTGIRFRGNPADPLLNGQLYYDSATDKLNFTHRNETTDLMASVNSAIPRIIFLNADSTTSQAKAKSTGLKASIEAGKKYSVIINGRSSCSGTGGIYYGVYISGGQLFAGQIFGSNASSNANAAVVKLPKIGSLTTTALNKFSGPGTFVLMLSFRCSTSGYFDFIYASAKEGEVSKLQQFSSLIIQELR